MDRDELAALIAYSSNKQDTSYKKYGYEPDTYFNTKDTNVLVKNNIPYVLHRGSKSIKDFRLDAELILGRDVTTSKRFRRADNITKAVEKKYKTKANAIGYSLGGLMAEFSTAKGKIYTYNKAATIQSLRKTTNPKQIDIRREGDIISGLAAFKKNTVTLEATVNINPKYITTHNPLTQNYYLSKALFYDPHVERLEHRSYKTDKINKF